MARRISLKTVAVAAGVSVATASLALSGDRRVATATRAKVERCARELGYVRDPMMSSLAAGRFRHSGKPLAVAACLGDGGGWLAQLQLQAIDLGMAVRPLDDPLDDLGERAVAEGAAALVIYHRGMDHSLAASFPLPVVLWEDESPAEPAVDVVETCEWWSITVATVGRLRRLGFARPALALNTATPRHWHDDVRLAAGRSLGMPVLEWDGHDRVLLDFIEQVRPDALAGLVISPHHCLQRHGVALPFAAMLVHEGAWSDGIAGWVVDQEQRGRMTLELIEQRLRFGPRPPRRIIIPPRWRDGPSLRLGR
jgi:hypothetical protein